MEAVDFEQNYRGSKNVAYCEPDPIRYPLKKPKITTTPLCYMLTLISFYLYLQKSFNVFLFLFTL